MRRLSDKFSYYICTKLQWYEKKSRRINSFHVNLILVSFNNVIIQNYYSKFESTVLNADFVLIFNTKICVEEYK